MFKPPVVPELLLKLFRFLEAKRDIYISDLKELVAIQSDSSNLDQWPQINKIALLMEIRLKKLGARTEVCNIGKKTISAGSKVNLPPILISVLGNDTKKKTLVIYSYLDISPAKESDGWLTDPFSLTEVEGRLYGRGVCSNKGVILSWLHTIEVFQKLLIPLPINIKFIFEGMHKVGSLHLDSFLHQKRDLLFSNASGVVMTNSHWLDRKKPCIVYGQRGSCSFTLEITGLSQDIDSGTYAGSVYEPMADLIFMLNQLVDGKAKIKIPDLHKDVVWLTPEEEQIYKKIDYDAATMKEALGARGLAHKEEIDTVLMHQWRNPSLSIHGIEGAFSEPGTRTVIPAKVKGHFTIQIVEKQIPACVHKYVDNYIKKLWSERQSPNRMELKMLDSSLPWSENICGLLYATAQKAAVHTYKGEPNMIREGGVMPVVQILKDVANLPIVLLAFAKSDDTLDGVNEQMSVKSYLEGHKFVASYMYEMGLAPGKTLQRKRP